MSASKAVVSSNPVPEWMSAPVKGLAKCITSGANSCVRVAINIEGMIPLTEETVRTVVKGREVIELLD